MSDKINDIYNEFNDELLAKENQNSILENQNSILED